MIVDKVIEYINNSEHLNKDILIPILNKAVFLKCQNVADYLLMENEKEVFDFEKDFSNIAPPWENFVIEWKFPKYVYSKELGKTPTPIGFDCNIFNLVITNPKIPSSIPKETKWMLNSLVFTEINDELFFMGIGLICINEQGKIIIRNEGKDNSTMAFAAYEGKKEYLKFYIEARLIHLMAITFCHCKNIEKVINQIPDGIVKKRKKNNKFPINKYYTLKIGNISGKKCSEDKGLWNNSLHICRGHFRTYTDDAPLFGKYHGTYWVPMHLKGSEEIGTVKKDYKI